MVKKSIIIDTDCGIDDAQAIMMALAAPNVEILAVTCVFGNASVEKVCQNVLMVLSVCEREGVCSCSASLQFIFICIALIHNNHAKALHTEDKSNSFVQFKKKVKKTTRTS